MKTISNIQLCMNEKDDDDDDDDDDEYLDKKEKKKLENKRKLERVKPSFIFQLLILFLAPPLFNFRPPVCSPSMSLHVYEESWNGGGKIKIVELQEKKITLNIQLCMN